jgi:hypothetical protein
MSIPKSYDINYYVGDLYQLVLYPKDESGNQYDLENHTGLLTIATERGNIGSTVVSASVQMSASPSRMVMTISPENGIILTGASYVYDLEVIDQDKPDEIYSFLTGTITTQQGVTRNQLYDYELADAGVLAAIEEINVIINGGVPTSIFYSTFDGGTP